MEGRPFAGSHAYDDGSNAYDAEGNTHDAGSKTRDAEGSTGDARVVRSFRAEDVASPPEPPLRRANKRGPKRKQGGRRAYRVLLPGVARPSSSGGSVENAKESGSPGSQNRPERGLTG